MICRQDAMNIARARAEGLGLQLGDDPQIVVDHRGWFGSKRYEIEFHLSQAGKIFYVSVGQDTGAVISDLLTINEEAAISIARSRAQELAWSDDVRLRVVGPFDWLGRKKPSQFVVETKGYVGLSSQFIIDAVTGEILSESHKPKSRQRGGA